MKKIILIIAVFFICLMLGITILLRTDFISDRIKTYIVPELEMATRHRVSIEKAVLNLIPPFIELKGIELFDDKGSPIITIKSARGYIGLGRLLQKKLSVRVRVNNPRFTIEMYKDRTSNFSPLIDSIQKYLKQGKKARVTIEFKGVSSDKGEIDFRDESESINAHAKGLSFRLRTNFLQKGFRIKTSADELKVKVGTLPDLILKMEARFRAKDRLVKIEQLKITNLGSSIGFEGDLTLSDSPAVDLKTKIILMAKSFRDFFGLKEKPAGEVSITGRIKGDISHIPKVLPELDLNIIAELPVGLLKEITKRQAAIEGIIGIKAEIKGEYPQLKSKGDISLSEGNIYGIRVKKLESEFNYESRRLSFSKINGEILEGIIDGELTALVPGLGGNERFAGLKSVEGNGWLKYMKKGNEAKGLTPSIIEMAEINFSSKGGYLTIEKGNIYTSFSSAELYGSLNMESLQTRFPFKIHSDNFAELVEPYFQGTKGIVDINGEMNGSIERPIIEGNMEITSAQVKGVDVQKGYSKVRYQDRELSFTGLKIEQDQGEYLVDGKIVFIPETDSGTSPLYEARAKIRNGNPRKIASIFYKDLPIDSAINGEMTFKGSPKVYEGEADITLNKGKAYGQDFDRTRIKANLKRVQDQKGEIIFPSIQIEIGGDILNADGRIGFGEGFNGRISSKRIALANINVLNPSGLSLANGRGGGFVAKKGAAGFASIRMTGKGTFKIPEVIADLEFESVSYRKGVFGDGKAVISLKDGRLNTSAKIGGLKLDGEMAVTGDLPWNASISLKDAGFEDFLSQGTASPASATSGKLSIVATGNIKAEGKGTDPDRLFATTKLNAVALNIFGYKMHNSGDVEISIKARDLKVSSFKFMGPEGAAFEIGGGMKIKSSYALHLYGKSDIGLLRVFIPQIEYINGEGEFVIGLSERWEDPKIQGTINLKGGSLKIRDFPQRIGKLSGYFTFEKDRLILNYLRGESGGGKFDFSGFMAFKGFSLRNFYIQGSVKGVRYRNPEAFTSTLDGTLAYEGNAKTQNLSGDVVFRRALYNKRIDWKSMLLEVRKIEKPKTEGSLLMNTNLNVHMSGKIQVDNNIGKGPVGIDLLLKGTPARPLLFGRAEATEGQIFFRNNAFRIISVSADFLDPNRINPVFNIIAVIDLKGYRVHLSLSGVADRFTLSLSSDPPLSDADILALLTVGQPSKSLQGMEAGIGASEATSFLTGKLQDVLEDRFKNIAGLDRFQVDPYVTRSSAAGGPRLTVGKTLLNGKLYMTYSANIGTSEEQVLSVEYKLSNNMSLLGVRDDQGQLGGDVKFRFEFR